LRSCGKRNGKRGKRRNVLIKAKRIRTSEKEKMKRGYEGYRTGIRQEGRLKKRRKQKN